MERRRPRLRYSNSPSSAGATAVHSNGNPSNCSPASQSTRRKRCPNKKLWKRAEQDKREGKSPSTQAGEFVHEEIHHIREGKHGAASAKQAVAIGLSKARRAGVDLPPPKKGRTSEKTRKAAERDSSRGRSGKKKVSAKRSRSSEAALKREPRSAASHKALSRQAKSAARRRKAA
jgi:uncharacterized protein DUF6496